GEQYYHAYLEKVAKHQRYLVGEEVSDPDSPAPKLAKATKPKATKFGNEEVDLQKAVEESLKDVHAAHQGPLPSVVIREPESGKFQPLPDVQGQGKEKVGKEQAAQVLFNL
ncbi:hypothetical protein Tco_0334726, partial [Tanacetum coccineum]